MVEPLRMKTMTLEELQRKTVKLIRMTCKHLMTPCALNKLTDSELYDKLSDFRSRIETDMEILKDAGNYPEYDRIVRLRDQVKKTWSPPFVSGNERLADAAQTSTMLAIAYVMGPEFLGELTTAQQAAVDSGLKTMRTVLGE